MAAQRFYVIEKLGPKQSLTPEEFLLCEEVPIARTGPMQYTDREIPIGGDANGMVTVHRNEDEVFRPDFIASFNGKPVVDDHPPEDVKPRNWKQFSKGVVMNPRRGTGAQAEFLIADLLICDQETIRAVMSGKREVSCGYDAEYEKMAEGIGRQFNMIGNHVALVESGRCGPRCAISDRKPTPTRTGDCAMSTKKRKWFDAMADKLRKAIASKDEAAVEEILEDAEAEVPNIDEDPDTHIHLDTGGVQPARGMTDDDLNERFQGIEDALAELKAGGPAGADVLDGDDLVPAGEEITDADIEEEVTAAKMGDAKAIMKSKDSSAFQDSYAETISLAEILVPGIRLPAYTADAAPRKTFDAICGLRKTTLDLAYHQPETRAIIDGLNGGKELQLTKMSCRDARVLFRAAAGVKKASNTKDSNFRQDYVPQAGGGLGVKGDVKTPAQLNEANKKFYGTK